MFEKYFQELPINSALHTRIEAIKDNNNRSKKILEEIAKLRNNKVPVVQNNVGGGVIKIDIIDNNNIDEELEKLFSEISVLEIADLTEEEIIGKLEKIIGLDNKRFAVLIDKIKLKLGSEAYLLSNMFFESKKRDEQKELKILIEGLRVKINLLSQLGRKKEVFKINQVSNNIFFLTSNNGNVIALESLRKNIPCEYYAIFKSLILSIKDNSFKGIKYMSYNKPFFELKDFKVRVLVGALGNGNYIIIDAFMKKEDTSEYYKNFIENRKNQYLLAKDYYLRNLTSEEFIMKHLDYLAEVLTLLDSKSKDLGGLDNDKRSI